MVRYNTIEYERTCGHWHIYMWEYIFLIWPNDIIKSAHVKSDKECDEVISDFKLNKEKYIREHDQSHCRKTIHI